MFQSDKVECKDVTAKVEAGYSAPQLVAVGRAVELVQGTRDDAPYRDWQTGHWTYWQRY
jgi:hypothetical protein